jgi:hypothetical protein
VGNQSKSPNIKIFGRAVAPHLGHSGKRPTARIVSRSISTRTELPEKIPIPQDSVHCIPSKLP